MRMRVNEPPGVDKGVPKKVWCYEMIKSVAYGEVDDFDKGPNKNYAIEDLDFNQVDFPINYSMFTFA